MPHLKLKSTFILIQLLENRQAHSLLPTQLWFIKVTEVRISYSLEPTNQLETKSTGEEGLEIGLPTPTTGTSRDHDFGVYHFRYGRQNLEMTPK